MGICVEIISKYVLLYVYFVNIIDVDSVVSVYITIVDNYFYC